MCEFLCTVGGDNNLRVFLAKYRPDWVRCYGRMTQPSVEASCLSILYTMDTSTEAMTFGNRGDADANVKLPKTLISRAMSPSPHFSV